MDDLEIALRLARVGSMVALGQPLVLTRQHGANLSASFWDDRLRDLRERTAVFESFFAREGAAMPKADRLLRIVRRRLAEAAYWSSASHLLRGRPADAFRLYRHGARLCPTAMIVPPLGYLSRMDGLARRMRAVMSEATGLGAGRGASS